MNYIFLLLFYITFPFCQSFAQNNVGIGKAAPAYKLDVAGSINADSVYRLRGITMLTSGLNGQVYMGDSAGGRFAPATANHNTAIGIYSGSRLTSGDGNAFFGDFSGRLTNLGVHNSFFGRSVGNTNTAGNCNSFFGYEAGSGNVTEQMNSFFGYQTGKTQFGTGSYNTVIGALSGASSFIGERNTFIGYDVDPVANAVFTIDNSTAIGHQSRVSASNQMRFGNGNVTSIGGYVGWSNLSDGRFKTNVKEDVQGLAFIKKLRPVTYKIDRQKLEDFINPTPLSSKCIEAKQTTNETIYSGFIAQEVEQAAKESGFAFSGVDAPTNEGDTYGLRYAEFTVPLVKAVQELAKENEELKREIAAIKKQLKNK